MIKRADILTTLRHLLAHYIDLREERWPGKQDEAERAARYLLRKCGKRFRKTWRQYE